MTTLRFRNADARRVIEHAARSTEFTFGGVPAVGFVHDHGVYLMSNGVSPGKPLVVYADGCNPTTDEDWWDTSLDLVGGDDFLEVIGLHQFMITGVQRGDDVLIEVGTDEIEVTTEAPQTI